MTDDTDSPFTLPYTEMRRELERQMREALAVPEDVLNPSNNPKSYTDAQETEPPAPLRDLARAQELMESADRDMMDGVRKLLINPKDKDRLKALAGDDYEERDFHKDRALGVDVIELYAVPEGELIAVSQREWEKLGASGARTDHEAARTLLDTHREDET